MLQKIFLTFFLLENFRRLDLGNPNVGRHVCGGSSLVGRLRSVFRAQQESHSSYDYLWKQRSKQTLLFSAQPPSQ